MESAIPAHLRAERTRPRRVPDDYAPPYPAWVARHPASVEQVVMAYFGVQYSAGAGEKEAEAHLQFLSTAFTLPDGPGHWDRARYIDEAGFTNVISVAYWDDMRKFEAWQGQPAFNAWWQDPGHALGSAGLFLELFKPRVERYETNFSSADGLEGVGRLSTEMSCPVQEHAYWGSARDRIPLSQTDAMHPAGKIEANLAGGTRSKRIVVAPHENICLIRSGQDWAQTSGVERDLYRSQMEPVLREGMNYLRDEGLQIGCYTNRYLTVLDEAGRETERSFGMGIFRSLADLERWSEAHPTHVAIFGTFMRIAQQLNFDLKLKLYHEVTVARAEEQYFEYVNCHPATGLLKAAAARAHVPPSG